jgi:hypothetical protein
VGLNEGVGFLVVGATVGEGDESGAIDGLGGFGGVGNAEGARVGVGGLGGSGGDGAGPGPGVPQPPGGQHSLYNLLSGTHVYCMP